MKRRLLATIMLLALTPILASFVLLPAPAHAAQKSGSSPLKLAIPSAPLTTAGGTAAGTLTNAVFKVTSFANQNGQLVANGTLTGTMTTASGATQSVKTAATAVVNQASGTCQILDLTIGPINLNLLGLVVQTNTIHLNITAQQGPGNLLGNLLCAVAGLLDNNGGLGGLLGNLLNQLVADLNQILGQL